jgi:hypothetical protein
MQGEQADPGSHAPVFQTPGSNVSLHLTPLLCVVLQ